MVPLKISADEAFIMSAEIIGRKWCLNPEPVEYALRKLHKTPAAAFRIAITMGSEEFTTLTLQGQGEIK